MHAPAAYRSRDVDMVVIGGIDDNTVFIATLASIGFALKNGMFVHERSPYTVEFVPSPVAIAGDTISEFARIETAFGPVRVLSATDVVKDRINKYIAYEDPESFEVAVSVARIKNIDMNSLAEFIQRQAADVAADAFQKAFIRLQTRLGRERPRAISALGFTTAFRLHFLSIPTSEMVEAVARRIQLLLDEEREQVDANLDGVTIKQTAAIQINTTDQTFATIPLEVSTKRNLALVDRFVLASRVVDYVRERLERFPELAEIPDDGTPPVATVGF
jgi:hypothetical protein